MGGRIVVAIVLVTLPVVALIIALSRHADVECPVVAPPVVVAAPTAKPIVAPPPLPPASPPPRVPTESVPCAPVTDGKAALELVADGKAAVVCWSNGMCVDESLRGTTRPTPKPEVARVDGDRICTAARCDPMGARLRAAASGRDVSATVDHAIVVVETGGDIQLWNRASDRRIATPRPGPKPGEDGDVTRVDILGTRALVVRGWGPKIIPPDGAWPSRAAIVDATGEVTGRVFVPRERERSAIADLGADRFIVANGSGGFALVVRGVPAWFGDLAGWNASPVGNDRGGDRSVWWGQDVSVAVVALEGDPPSPTTQIDGTPDGTGEIARAAYLWCSWAGCHVGRFDISIHTRAGRETQSLYRASDHELPVCTASP